MEPDPVFCFGSHAQDQRGRGKVVDFRTTLNLDGVTIRSGTLCSATSMECWFFPRGGKGCRSSGAGAGQEGKDG